MRLWESILEPRGVTLRSPREAARRGFSPLYTRFEDLYEGVSRFRRVLDEERWRRYAGADPAVT